MITIQKQGGRELSLGQSKEQPVSFNCQKAERSRAKEFTLSIQHSKDNFLEFCWGPQFLPLGMCLTLSSMPHAPGEVLFPQFERHNHDLLCSAPMSMSTVTWAEGLSTISIPETLWCAFPHASWTSVIDGTSWCKASWTPVYLWADWTEVRNPGNCASLYNTESSYSEEWTSFHLPRECFLLPIHTVDQINLHFPSIWYSSSTSRDLVSGTKRISGLLPRS